VFGKRFGFGHGHKAADDTTQFASPPPPKLDLEKLRREAAERAARTQDALVHGKLPPDVIERIQSQERGELPWTSDLSVNEWAAVGRFKLHPLALVMGSAFYHVGYIPNQNAGWFTQSHEMQAQTTALYEGWRLAIKRMEQEATLLNANAVIGVRLERRPSGIEHGVYEYVAFGTAVAVDGLKPAPTPVLSTVSGQDFARLLAGGAMPVNIAIGGTYHYLVTDWWDVQQESSWYNQEMQHFQSGMSQARRLATRRLREDASKVGGSGVVGAALEIEVEEIRSGRSSEEGPIMDHIIIAFAMGTAVEYVQPGRPESLRVEAVYELR
jgi:uncharacterized protein YbjQ (UPF0145 family)